MIDEVLQDLLQRHHLRGAVDQREVDDAEGALHRRVLVEPVQHDLRNGVALELDDEAHPFAVGFIAHAGDAFDPLLRRELGDRDGEIGLVHLIGQLGDDQGILAGALILFDADASAHVWVVEWVSL